MRILLLIHGFNSLSQRIFVELEAAGHDVSIEFDINDDLLEQAVRMFQPEVILAPYLKRAIPETIWKNYLCLILHPGIVGDRGPSAIDWAILQNRSEWGVTVLQAEAEMDAGPIWAWQSFPMRAASKSSIYRSEVSDAALSAIHQTLKAVTQKGFAPRPLDSSAKDVKGRLQPAVLQKDRAINWQTDSTATVLRKIHSADGVPGVRDNICGQGLFLHDARAAESLSGVAGSLLATSGPAICRATSDGAVWIGHLRLTDGEHRFKRAATQALQGTLSDLPEIPIDSATGYQEICYHEDAEVGYLRFNFYNGAMSVAQCERLLAAYAKACTRQTRVIVLEGGDDFWSNGIHLNVIEAAASPADESWRNINAMDDLAEAIIRTDSHLTIAAMRGNAGAGGVFLARACDRVWLREAVILNPHYKDMGNLYGSEFWTYLLPRYAGEENAGRIARQRLPMRAPEAVSLGLADACFGESRATFVTEVCTRARDLAQKADFPSLLAEKNARRLADEAEKPLDAYRQEELAHMKRNFYGFDPSYHVARYNFVHKICKSRTPITLARHRDKRLSENIRTAS